MATAIITLTDVGDDGEVTADINFGQGGFDSDSEAHTLAGELALDLKEGKTDD